MSTEHLDIYTNRWASLHSLIPIETHAYLYNNYNIYITRELRCGWRRRPPTPSGVKHSKAQYIKTYEHYELDERSNAFWEDEERERQLGKTCRCALYCSCALRLYGTGSRLVKFGAHIPVMAVSGLGGGLPHWAYSCTLSISFARKLCYAIYSTASFSVRPPREMFALPSFPSVRMHRMRTTSSVVECGEWAEWAEWVEWVIIVIGVIGVTSDFGIHTTNGRRVYFTLTLKIVLHVLYHRRKRFGRPNQKGRDRGYQPQRQRHPYSIIHGP